MNRCLPLVFLLMVFGCKKNDLPTTRASLQIVNPATGEPVLLENTTGNWDFHAKQFNIDAYGYNYEVLKINASNVNDTGMIHNLSGDNIKFYNGLDFYSAAIESGNIHISRCSRDQINGEFKIMLLSKTNDYYLLEGSFEIINSN